MENAFLESEKKYVEGLLTTTARDIELLTGRSNKEIMKLVTRFNELRKNRAEQRAAVQEFYKEPPPVRRPTPTAESELFIPRSPKEPKADVPLSNAVLAMFGLRSKEQQIFQLLDNLRAEQGRFGQKKLAHEQCVQAARGQLQRLEQGNG